MSVSVARDHVEQACEQDKKRRDKIAVVVSAPVAVVGLAIGVFVSMILTEGTNKIGVFNIAIPLLLAGILFVISTKVVEHVLPVKARDPDLSMAEIAQLEQLSRNA